MNTMNTTTFTITGMTCSHCVRAVTDEIFKLDGVKAVRIDLTTGAATVDSERELDPLALASAVDEAGYEVAS